MGERKLKRIRLRNPKRETEAEGCRRKCRDGAPPGVGIRPERSRNSVQELENT
jgi:hypothetical protein